MTLRDALQKLCGMAGNNNVSEDIITDMVEKLSIPSEYKLYDDYPTMVEEIRQYTKENGGSVEKNDEPMQLRLGFKHVETGQSWRLPLSRWKRSQRDENTGVQKIMFLQEHDLLLKYLNNEVSDECINKLLMLK